MKLNIHHPNIETSENFDDASKLFAIGDAALIFDILRSRLYSNTTQSVCREISSNSRDAHREVGKFNVPCKIVLPNSLEPFIKFIDYGPGISPDRIANIFIKYGSSTKREDNVQVGGFGLGAKSVFSISDSFNVITRFDNIKYHYVCFIDETRVGKLTLLSSEPTTEENGTEIVIPVKPQDFKSFSDNVEFVTRHWDVRPIVTGNPSFRYQEISTSLKGKDWAISKVDNDIRRTVKLIIDGIEYPVDINALKGYAQSGASILDAIYGVIYLYFGVGDLSLQASREAVHLDKSTQNKIAERLDELSKDLTKSIQDTVNALPDLWSANCYFNNELTKTFANINFIGKLEWQGNPITKGSINFNDADVYTFSKGTYSKRTGADPNKIGRTLKRSIYFEENAAIYQNDLGIKDPTVKNVLKAFEDDPKLQHLYVVQPTEVSKLKIDDIIKNYKLDKYELKKLSTITKQGKSYTISGVRLLVFKFDVAHAAFKQIKYSDMELDTNEKVICSLERDAYNSVRRVMLKNNKSLSNDIVKSILQTNTGVSIYGVDDVIPADKVKEHFDDFIPIDDFIQNKVLKNASIDYKQIKYAMRNLYSLNEKNLKFYPKFKSTISNNDSLYIRNLELQMSIKELIEKHSGILKIYESINGSISDKEVDDYITINPNLSIEMMLNKVKTQYPLLNHLDFYHQEKVLEPIIHYINLIDKELKNTNKTI